MPFGTRLDAAGATFRLWAPAARQVELALGTGPAPQLQAATRQDDGWWEGRVPGAGPGTAYRWRIDGELLVPDPAARSNPEGPHGPSVLVDPTAFEWDAGWTGRPWHDTVLYELHVGSFTREGTFAAAAARLQGLADLGVTAIELMPVASFGGRFGWGYDGVLPFAPHAAYGSPEDLKTLVQEAHRLGLMVFLDVVYNHFGPDGNYLSTYAPEFFSKTKHSPWGAAINFDGPGSRWVREFFIQNALYWVQEYRSTACGWTRCTRSATTARCTCSTNCRGGCARPRPAATSTWCWRTRTTAGATSPTGRCRGATTRSGTTTSTTCCTWR
jgi:1,4-alpha-glucan branching enzyme/maltooligosyltrehalose trehalohydrolase